MTDVNQLITDHLDIWTSATEKTSSAGRGNAGAIRLYGIKKLRGLIMDLAVRGKLVAQDENEGTGMTLVDMSFRERTRAVREKKTRKQKTLPEIEKTELMHSIPDSWAYIRLGDLTNYGITDKAEAFNATEDTWILELEDVEKESSKLLQKVFFSERRFKSSKNRFREGDVIYGKLRPYLDKALVADLEGVCTTEMIPMRPYADVSSKFLRLVLKSPEFIRYANDSTHGMNLPRLGTEKARMAVVPLPPTAEQHRIVAKVDELMGICDALEAQAEGSLKAHQTLVETCLATLTNSQTPEDLTQNWTRLEAHFDTLFTTEASVVCLKEVMLQLGVRGKLLPQNEDDEVASVLLQKLLRGKSHKKKRGRGAVGESTATEPPCSLPESWIWHRFGDLVEFQSELVKPDGYQDFLQIAPDIIEKGTGRLVDQRTVGESGIRGPNNRFYAGQILYSKIRPSLSKAVIAPYDGLCSADMYPLKSLIDPDFLLLSILSEDFLVQVRKLENRIKMPKLNVGSLSSIYVAVPPLSEQPRIVEKVKSMFGICDQIRANIEKSRQSNIQIADTLTSKIH